MRSVFTGRKKFEKSPKIFLKANILQKRGGGLGGDFGCKWFSGKEFGKGGAFSSGEKAGDREKTSRLLRNASPEFVANDNEQFPVHNMHRHNLDLIQWL
jgi:hypothetical protein